MSANDTPSLDSFTLSRLEMIKVVLQAEAKLLTPEEITCLRKYIDLQCAYFGRMLYSVIQ